MKKYEKAIIFIGLFSVFAGGAEARKLSSATAARNLAILAYAEKRCPSLRINYPLIAQGMEGAGVSQSEISAAISAESEKAFEKLSDKFGNMPDNQFCAMVEDMFGPGGTIAENFLKRR